MATAKALTTGVSKTNPWWYWLGWSLAIIMLDQITKLWIVANYQLGDSTFVTSFFNVVRVHNSGAAFSFLADAGGWQRWFFTAVAILATIFFIYLLKTHTGNRLFSFAVACVLGGAIGNVIDRVWYGYVVDFLDFHWSFLSAVFYGGHFPAFNVADSAISIGAVCMIWSELRSLRQSKDEN